MAETDHPEARESLPPGTFMGKDGRRVEIDPGRQFGGAGKQGKVAFAHYIDNPEEKVVIKEPLKNDESGRGQAEAEAAVLMILTDRNVPHIPQFHYFHKGGDSTSSDTPYFVMGLAKGENIMSLRPIDIDEDTSVEIARQVAECERAAHAAGIVNREGDKEIFWDPVEREVTAIDWGGVEDATEENLRNVAYIPLRAYNTIARRLFKEPTKDASKALSRLSRIFSHQLSFTQGNKEVTLNYQSAISATGKQIFDIMDRIFAGESYATLQADIEALVKKEAITLTQYEPMDLEQVNRLVRNEEVARNLYVDHLTKKLDLDDNSMLLLRSNLRLFISLFAFDGNPQGYRKFITKSIDEWLSNPNLAQLHTPARFFKSIVEHFIDEKEYRNNLLNRIVPKEGGIQSQTITEINQGIIDIFVDILVLSLRPDIATNGNCTRLQEGLDKLAQYLTPEQIAQGQQILDTVMADRIAEDGRFKVITERNRAARYQEMIGGKDRDLNMVWQTLANGRWTLWDARLGVDNLKAGFNHLTREPKVLDSETTESFVRPATFLADLTNYLLDNTPGKLGSLQNDLFDLSRDIMDYLLFGSEVPQATAQRVRRFMSVVKNDPAIRKGFIREWQPIPQALEEEEFAAA